MLSVRAIKLLGAAAGGGTVITQDFVFLFCVSYAAILEAFATMSSSTSGSVASILRLSPLARGPEMGSAVWQLPQLTFEALRNAYGNTNSFCIRLTISSFNFAGTYFFVNKGMLGAAPRATLKGCTVFLCVPDGRACRRYWTAGFLGPGGRKTLPTAPEEEDGQAQISQSETDMHREHEDDDDDDDDAKSVSTSGGAGAAKPARATTAEEDARRSGADTWVVGDRCEVFIQNICVSRKHCGIVRICSFVLTLHICVPKIFFG